MRLLVLGGTTEGRLLASGLAGRSDVSVTTSLAGRTSAPLTPAGRLRTGGFGGAPGLATYLRVEGVTAVVDATHPFAAVMRWHALEACDASGVARLRLERPGWVEGDGDRWQRVGSLAAAASAVAASDRWRSVLVTTGRSGLEAFVPAAAPTRRWVVRSVDAPDPSVVEALGAVPVLGRGPWDRSSEVDLMRRHGIDLLVTKDSGGSRAKLDAAAELGIDVLVVDRPAAVPGPLVESVEGALRWVEATIGGRD